VATIDDDLSIVSTYNLDLLSGYVNGEIGAVMKSKAFNARMREVFVADQADPKNGVLEYAIEKDESGRAILAGGKPKVVFGPDDHLPKKVLEDYASRRKNWMRARDSLPYFRPLRRPALEYAATLPN
jgi:phosphatidylserine/phosphatidylglycerophosphate/cardiolipin synthase-like enzyme